MINHLWIRFSAIYGEKWDRKFNRDPLVKKEIHDFNIQLMESEWYDAIKSFSKKAIGLAIQYARDGCIWPPSISEFVKLCNLASERLRYEPVNANQVLLIKKKQTAEEIEHSQKIAEKFIGEINDKLHKRRKE